MNVIGSSLSAGGNNKDPVVDSGDSWGPSVQLGQQTDDRKNSHINGGAQTLRGAPT